MKVLIEKAKKPTFWYAGMIGKEFDVIEDPDSDKVYIVDDVEKDKCIDKEDCVLV